LSLQSIHKRAEHSTNIARPQSKAEFLSLDFVARCAVAGLQLGRTKVFLRREAFDRIEAIRSNKFFGSAAKIQAMVRGKIVREHFKRMRVAAVKIQALLRVRLSQKTVYHLRRSIASTKIQSTWRMISVKSVMSKTILKKRVDDARILKERRKREVKANAATLIQARARGIKARNCYFSALFGIIRLQAIFRGKKVRTLATIRMNETRKKVVKAASPPVTIPPPPIRKMSPRKSDTKKMVLPSPTSSAVSISEFYKFIKDEDWATVEKLLDSNPVLAEEVEPSSGELPLHVIARHTNVWTLLVDMMLVLNPKALIHKDKMGALPIHHAGAHDNLAALEIIFSAYKDGVNEVDVKGRLPLHVAAEFDAADAVKFLLSQSSEGAFTMVYRPVDGSGGGLPLHVACRNYASIGVITALLAENFASAKRCDENGDLPLHLILKCGEVVDQVVVKTLLTCFSAAASRTDMNGDLPLAIAIKNKCNPAVINGILMQYPNAASVFSSDGHSPLHLAFEHCADDRTILGLLNHAPEFATLVDKKSGLLPIQVATDNEHSHFIVHNLLRRDMPIDLEEKVRAQLLPHHYSWNHIVSNTDDMYHQVITKILQQCTQPQVLALAHVEGPNGKIALASATTVCKHELRVMLRLFNTLEVVNQRPAYTNPLSDTQIFYALRYEPPSTQSEEFTVLHEEKKDHALGDYVEDWDDTSVTSSMSRQSVRSVMSSRSQLSLDDKLRQIRKEKGQQVIAKLTSRSDIVERELKVRKDYHLSRHYVPAVISVHHTVQHAAYSEAMAEPGYCITMEGADTTAENLLLDMRKAGKAFPVKALKRIGIALLHMHEHNLVHGDFGTHNIGKFGSRWKLLGVGGSVAIGRPTNPNRGFYHPPESIVVENKRAALGKKAISAVVVSIPASTNYDIWAFGVLVYEAVAGHPLSAYACRGKRAMTSAEVAKIGLWDDHNMKKALKYIVDADENAKSLIKTLLHYDPEKRLSSMREVLEHPFFASASSRSASKSSLPEKKVIENPVQTEIPSTKEARSITAHVPQVQNKPLIKERTVEDFVPQITTTQSLSSSSPEGSQDHHSLSSPGHSFSKKNNVLDTSYEVSSTTGSVTSSRSKKSKKLFGSMRGRFGKKKRQSLNA
jgi:ankyrin repeat protein